MVNSLGIMYVGEALVWILGAIDRERAPRPLETKIKLFDPAHETASIYILFLCCWDKKNASVAVKSLNSNPTCIKEDPLHTSRKLYEGIFPIITEFNDKALQATYY